MAVLVEERWTLRRGCRHCGNASPFGQGAAWPVVQTVQRDGVRAGDRAGAGAARRPGHAAQRLALRLADGLGVVGVLAVELFRRPLRRCWSTARDAYIIPGTGYRQGARQFEQHLRAVDYPLGDSDAVVCDGDGQCAPAPWHGRRP